MLSALIRSPKNLLTFCLLLYAGTFSPARAQRESKEEPKIQDNSFLLEEAYNQEHGVVQHISTFSRMWNSKDWSYTFTQEWPVPRNWRHQVSYTLVGAHAGALPASGVGLGDTVFNYRYQVLGNGDSRFAFAPRASLLVPTGNVARGIGYGAPGVQVNLPLSVVINRRLVTHWNAGSTFVPNAQAADHSRATTVGYNLGQSVIFVATPTANLLLEVVDSRFQSALAGGTAAWLRTTYLSPGIRWAHNFPSGLQIVPGVALPMGVGASAGERGLFLYLSFEHPIRRRPAP